MGHDPRGGRFVQVASGGPSPRQLGVSRAGALPRRVFLVADVVRVVFSSRGFRPIMKSSAVVVTRGENLIIGDGGTVPVPSGRVASRVERGRQPARGWGCLGSYPGR